MGSILQPAGMTKIYKRYIVLRKIMISALRLIMGKRLVNLDDILGCPFCKQKVQREQSSYICIPWSKAFPTKDGVPVMLKEKAIDL
jgi:uncharacterized protein YbaR (Trm112 family)